MERQSVTFELEDIKNGPNSEVWTTDLVHQAAYRENTLGLPLLCPEENTLKIEAREMQEFLSGHYVPSRMVLAGVNVDHEQFVALAERCFSWPRPQGVGKEVRLVDNSLSQYTGGEVKVRGREGGRESEWKYSPSSSDYDKILISF